MATGYKVYYIIQDADNDTCNGSIQITDVEGSTHPPYTYLWSTGSTSATISNLCPGDYTVTITDAHGCMQNTLRHVEVNNCVTTLNLNMYLEGYYVGSGFMKPAIKNGANGTSLIFLKNRLMKIPITAPSQKE